VNHDAAITELLQAARFCDVQAREFDRAPADSAGERADNQARALRARERAIALQASARVLMETEE
jgi:hypothetical protein